SCRSISTRPSPGDASGNAARGTLTTRYLTPPSLTESCAAPSSSVRAGSSPEPSTTISAPERGSSSTKTTTRTIPCSEALGGSSERGCSSGSLWVAPGFEGTASPSWANERCGHPSNANPARIIAQLRHPVLGEKRDKKRDCPK